ncbi:MAG: DUF456 domain-containing protein [Verrucomicrobiales bacterium]
MIRLALSWTGLGEGTLQAGIWTVTILLLLLGLIGTVLPMLPGPGLIFLAAVFHYLALRYLADVTDPGIGWPGFLILLLMLILALAFEMVTGAVGAKHFGSSKWGVAGAIAGGLIGIFFALPGIFIGPVVGALLAEMFLARRDLKPATKATWGTLLGTTAGLVLKVGMGVIMITYFLFDLFWLDW